MKNFLLTLIISFVALTSSGPVYSKNPSPAEKKQKECFVYISVSKDKNIKIFRLDRVNECLVFIDSVNVPGTVMSLCTDPLKSTVYAAMRSINSVGCLTLDHKTGKLTISGTTPILHNPVYISTDRKGKYLLTTSYFDNNTAVYPLKNNCLLKDPVIVLPARINPHMIKTDPSGKYVFIPNLGGNVIQQFILNGKGMLLPNNPEGISVTDKSGPRHFIFHPRKNIFYLVNELSCTVMVFTFDPSRGTLSGPVQEISTKPADYTSQNTCADIHVTPDGKFLYASNRGHNSLAAFAINQDDGKLTPIGHFATEKTPREFDIEPSGEFIISAGEGSGNIILYRIRPDGTLAPLHTYRVGQWPAWVMSLSL